MAEMKIDDVKQRTSELESYYGKRNSMYDEHEAIYFMTATDLPDTDIVKETLSPDPRNALVGGARLLTEADPKFSVPYEKNSSLGKRLSSRIEALASVAWQQACRNAQRPLHYDISLSAMLYGQIDIAIRLSQDVIDASSGPDKLRAQEAGRRSPIFFEVLNPRYGFPDFDSLGLRSYVYKRKLTVSQITGTYGDDGTKAIGQGKKATDLITVYDWWDISSHIVFVEGGGVIIQASNDYPFIPIVSQTAEGSGLFTDSDQRIQPFFYTLNKSKFWDRQNLALTVMYTNIFAVGSNPTFTFSSPIRKYPDVDWSTSVIHTDPGEQFAPLPKGVIDPSIMTGMEVANDKIESSTIYRQSLGEALGTNAPYATTALLNSAGRLPLLPYQRMAGWAIGDAMNKALRMLKLRGVEIKAGTGKTVTMNTDEIPDDLEVTATLEIALPQDEAQNIQIAIQGTQGQQPLFSKRYAREKLARIEQSDEMEQEIIDEQYAALQMQIRFQEEQFKSQMRLQAMQQQMQAQMQQGMAQQQVQPPWQQAIGNPPYGAQLQPQEQQGPTPEQLQQIQAMLQQQGQAPQGEPPMMGGPEQGPTTEGGEGVY